MPSPNTVTTSDTIDSDIQRVAARPVVTHGGQSVMSHYGYELQRPVYKNASTSTLLTLPRGEDSKDEAMEYQLGVPAACVAAFVYTFLKRRRRLSVIRDVPGPANPSWIFGMSLECQPGRFHPLLEVCDANREHAQGHQWYIQTEEAGGAARKFLETLGNIVRWNGPFGVRLSFNRTNVGDPYSESLLK